MKPRRGERALQQAVAIGAFGLLLGGEVLDFFKLMAALGAAVGIQGQGANPSREQITHSAYSIDRAAIVSKNAALSVSLQNTGISAR